MMKKIRFSSKTNDVGGWEQPQLKDSTIEYGRKAEKADKVLSIITLVCIVLIGLAVAGTGVVIILGKSVE